MKNTLQIFNYTVKNQNNSDNVLDIHIDGTIVDAETQQIYQDWWGDETSVSFKSVRVQVTNSGKKNINFWVNSYGGHVGDAMAIHDWIIQLKAEGYTVTTNCIGMACSAATYIVSAGKETSYISKNSFYMIHNVSGGIWGDVNTIENYAKTMRKFNDVITNYYADLTGKTSKQVTDWMNAETWFTGSEAVDNGFVKNLLENQNFTNKIANDLFPYKNTRALNLYNSFVKSAPTTNILVETDKTFLATLVNHYQASINLAKEILKTTNDPFVQALAGDIISDETDEIQDIQEYLTGVSMDNLSRNPFNNSINSNNANMNKKFVNVIVNALVAAGFISNSEEDKPKPLTVEDLTNSLTEAFKDFQPEAPSQENIDNAVANFFKDGLPENITTQLGEIVTNSTKGFVTNETFEELEQELESVKKDLVNGKGQAKSKDNVNENIDATNHEGVSWGNK